MRVNDIILLAGISDRKIKVLNGLLDIIIDLINMDRKKVRRTKSSKNLKLDNKIFEIEDRLKRTQTAERINKVLI